MRRFQLLRQSALSALLVLAPAVALAQAPPPPPTPPPDNPRPVSSLFTGAAHDFARLASETPLFILGVGGAIAAFGSTADQHLRLRVPKSRAVDAVFDAGDFAGDGYVQVGAALGTYAVGRFRHKPRLTAVGADLIEAQMVSGVLTQGLKLAIPRHRPDGRPDSFPSGHASAAFTTAGVLQRHFGWKVGVAAYGAAAYIGTSRMSENRHYLSDVLFGAAIGIASSRTLSIGGGAHGITVVPVATRDGAAVLVSALPQVR